MTKTYLDEVTQQLLQVADVAWTVGCGLNTSKSWAHSSNMPMAWLNVYVRNRYELDDPVLKFTCEGRGACNWRDLPMTDKAQAVMEDAKGYGLKNGTVFANLVGGVKCSVSACHTKESLTEDEIDILEEFTIVYGTMNKRKGNPPRDELHLRYLDLQANGAPPNQAQMSLGLSARSIAELKKDAIAEIGANGLPDAISAAMVANRI